MLATISFEAGPAGQPTLEALAALQALEGRKKVSVDEVPTGFARPAWQRLLTTPDGQLNHRAYTFAVLERLRAGLGTRDVFVTGGERWCDPRTKLLTAPAWDAARSQVCRTLNLSSDPSAAVAGLGAQLEEAYRRTAGRLTANAAVELADGKVKLSPLDRLEEPESLRLLRDRVGALLPRVDLPDVLAEVAAWTRFPEEFTHVSEAGARVDDLGTSVCAVLVAEACNVGLDPLARSAARGRRLDRLHVRVHQRRHRRSPHERPHRGRSRRP